MMLESLAAAAFKKYHLQENFGIEAATSATLSPADVLLPMAEGLRWRKP